MQADALPLAGAERARACPRSRSRRRAGRGRARARRGAAVRISPSAEPELRRRPPRRGRRRRAHGPREYGDFRSTKFAIASSAASKRSPDEHDGERRLGGDHRVPGRRRASSPARIASASAHRQVGQRGVELPAAPLARELRRRLDAADAVRDLDELRQLRRSAPRSGRPRPRARPASRARPTARTPRRAPRAPRPAARAARRASARSRAWWAIMSSTSRWPESANSSPSRKRCSGGWPAPSMPHARPRPRAGCRARGRT